MVDRPYTLLSCCMSMDGYLAGVGHRRLLLSNDADFDRVDAVRAGCDAILVGAATVRKDDPRLTVRTPARRDARVARGLSPSPAKVTLTCGARLDPAARFFTDGESERLVYCASSAVEQAQTAARLARRRWSTAGSRSTWPGWSGPVRPGHPAADGRGRRNGAHAVPHRRSGRRAQPGGRSVLRRRPPRPAVRRRRLPSRSTRNAGRGWPRFGRSATSCCCVTRCPPGSARRDWGRTARSDGVPA